MADSVDTDQTAPKVDQGLHYCLNLLDTLLYGRATMFQF